MAKTTVATGDNLTKKLWEKKLFVDTVKESYFLPKFGSTDGTKFVHINSDLTKGKGDAVTFGIRMRTDQTFRTNGQSEGNEGSLTTYDFNVVLNKERISLRDDSEMSRKRPIYDVEGESRAALMENGAEEIDRMIFDALVASPTRVFYATAVTTPLTTATAATAKAALTTSSLIWPDLISFARTWAETGGNRGQTPIKRVKVNGKKYYVLLIHPDVRYDLAKNSTMATAHREARERSDENPVFTGSDFIYDGVVIHSHESVPIATDAGSGGNVPWAKCTLLGQQAIAWAWGRRPKLVRETFDYEDEVGYDWSIIAGTEKPVFNSKDYGSAGFYVARTQISDAS